MHIDVDQVIQTVFPIDTQCNTTLCVVDIIMNTAMVTLKQHYFTWTMYNVYVHMQENTPPPPTHKICILSTISAPLGPMTPYTPVDILLTWYSKVHQSWSVLHILPLMTHGV